MTSREDASAGAPETALEAVQGVTDGDRRPALSPAARRALQEAEARRQAYLAREAGLPKELGGRGGNDPNRYGDWEIKGLTSDF